MVSFLIGVIVVLGCHYEVVRKYQDFCNRIPSPIERRVCLDETPRLQPYREGMWVVAGIDQGKCRMVYNYETIPSVITGEYNNSVPTVPSTLQRPGTDLSNPPTR